MPPVAADRGGRQLPRSGPEAHRADCRCAGSRDTGRTHVREPLAKNLKRFDSWARDEGVFNVRIYDADMPEYALAIDPLRRCRGGGVLRIGCTSRNTRHPRALIRIPCGAGAVRRCRILTEVSGVPGERIRVRLRRKQSGGGQYRKLESQAVFHMAREAGQRFWVNFDDYLDTGLFLDHRITRERARRAGAGPAFPEPVLLHRHRHCARGRRWRPRASTSVDMSRTYLQWARRNLDLNGIARDAHELIQGGLLSMARRGPWPPASAMTWCSWTRRPSRTPSACRCAGCEPRSQRAH